MTSTLNQRAKEMAEATGSGKVTIMGPAHKDVADCLYHGLALDPLNLPTMPYEQMEVDMVRKYLRPDMRVMLAGFGKGFLALVCATIVGPEHVFGYEADRALVEFGRGDIRLWGLALMPRHAALTYRAPGEEGKPIRRPFYRDPSWASSSLLPSPATQPVMVPGVDINEEVTRTGASALVLDVEGYEYDLLLNTNLDPIKAIVVEIHHHNVSPYAFTAYLEGKGFTEHTLIRHPEYPVSVLGACKL
jgi:hypothetical protein